MNDVLSNGSEQRSNNGDVSPDDRAFSRSVGARLRAVRHQRGLSLVDVEERSEGKWSASALGAYERGFRNLSVPRLHALAAFYQVPMAVLLGEPTAASGPEHDAGIVLDLEVLQSIAGDEPVMQFVNSIVIARGDFNGRMLSVRRDDLRALCALVGAATIDDGLAALRQWGVLIGAPSLDHRQS